MFTIPMILVSFAIGFLTNAIIHQYFENKEDEIELEIPFYEEDNYDGEPDAYEEGYEIGHEEGYADGFEDGFSKGIETMITKQHKKDGLI